MNYFQNMREIDYIVIVSAIIPFLLLGKAISKHNGAGQHILSWGLFALLDWVQFGMTIVSHLNPFLIGTYMFGSTTMFVLLLKYGSQNINSIVIIENLRIFIRRITYLNIKYFTPNERVILLVLLCIFIWLSVDKELAIFIAILSQIIAAIPLIKETYIRPDIKALSGNLGFFIANSLSLYSITKNNDFKFLDMFFPFAMLILGILIIVLILRPKIKLILNN